MKERKFDDAKEIIEAHENGTDISYSKVFKKQGFKRPIFVKNAEGLGLRVPKEDGFDVNSVGALVGLWLSDTIPSY